MNQEHPNNQPESINSKISTLIENIVIELCSNLVTYERDLSLDGFLIVRSDGKDFSSTVFKKRFSKKREEKHDGNFCSSNIVPDHHLEPAVVQSYREEATTEGTTQTEQSDISLTATHSHNSSDSDIEDVNDSLAEQLLQCSNCGKSFDKFGLRKHEVICKEKSDEEMVLPARIRRKYIKCLNGIFRCAICGKKFNHKTNAYRHLRYRHKLTSLTTVASAQKPCKVIDSQTSQKQTAQHLSTGTRCTVCGLECINTVALLSHARRVHAKRVIVTPISNKLSVPLKKRRISASLERSLPDQADQEPRAYWPMRCKLCPDSVPDRDAMYEHLRVSHNVTRISKWKANSTESGEASAANPSIVKSRLYGLLHSDSPAPPPHELMCMECNITLNSEAAFDKHIVLHHSSRAKKLEHDPLLLDDQTAVEMSLNLQEAIVDHGDSASTKVSTASLTTNVQSVQTNVQNHAQTSVQNPASQHTHNTTHNTPSVHTQSNEHPPSVHTQSNVHTASLHTQSNGHASNIHTQGSGHTASVQNGHVQTPAQSTTHVHNAVVHTQSNDTSVTVAHEDPHSASDERANARVDSCDSKPESADTLQPVYPYEYNAYYQVHSNSPAETSQPYRRNARFRTSTQVCGDENYAGPGDDYLREHSSYQSPSSSTYQSPDPNHIDRSSREMMYYQHFTDSNKAVTVQNPQSIEYLNNSDISHLEAVSHPSDAISHQSAVVSHTTECYGINDSSRQSQRQDMRPTETAASTSKSDVSFEQRSSLTTPNPYAYTNRVSEIGFSARNSDHNLEFGTANDTRKVEPLTAPMESVHLQQQFLQLQATTYSITPRVSQTLLKARSETRTDMYTADSQYDVLPEVNSEQRSPPLPPNQ